MVWRKKAAGRAEVWLVGFAEGALGRWRRLWRRLCPRLCAVGELADGRAVRLVELRWTSAQFWALPQARRCEELQRLLLWLRRRGAARIGLPLRLLLLLGEGRPPEVADGRELAARAFVAEAARGADGLASLASLAGRQVALLGVSADWHRFFCDALLEQGARPALYGPRAVSVAELYYRERGVAMPVFGARKTIRSSDLILLLDPAMSGAAGLGGGRALLFDELRLPVAGKFTGRFAFGVFPACAAAALLPEQAE